MSNNIVKDHFDSLSKIYSKNFSEEKSGKTYEFRTRLQLVEELLSGNGGILLDCACGTGEITAKILTSGHFKAAVISDISEKMLNLAAFKIEATSIPAEISYQLIDIFEYRPASEVRFDVILCLGLVAHIESLENLLVHLRSMLADDGKLILQSTLSDHLGVRITRFLTNKKFYKKSGYKLNYYSNNDLRKIINLAGMDVIDSRRFTFDLPFADRIWQFGNYWLETIFKRISARYGSNVLFVLKKLNKLC